MKRKIKCLVLIFVLCCSFCFFAKSANATVTLSSDGKYKITHNSLKSGHQEKKKNGKWGKFVSHKDPAKMKKGTVSSFYKITEKKKKKKKYYYYKCKKCGKGAWYSDKKYK